MSVSISSIPVSSLAWLRFKVSLGAALHSPVPGVIRQDENIGNHQFGSSPLWGAWYRPDALRDANLSENYVILYLHGGGFSTGSVETHDAPVRMICQLTQIPVFSLEYHRVRQMIPKYAIFELT
jgi:acetyl esterase/lipase